MSNLVLLIQWVGKLPFLGFFTPVELTKDEKERYYSADNLIANINYYDLFKRNRKIACRLNER